MGLLGRLSKQIYYFLGIVSIAAMIMVIMMVMMMMTMLTILKFIKIIMTNLMMTKRPEVVVRLTTQYEGDGDDDDI